MRRLEPLSTLVKLGNFLACLSYHVESVVGRGPDMLPTRPIWDLPKEIKDVPYQYCCEYEPSAVPSSGFELSKYKYGPHGGTLQPAPCLDLGIVDNDAMRYNLLHWRFWRLPKKQFTAPMLYCDVTDI
uniref:Uncharacterized protein n=1 Tax=Physcomitrium patens TaxID=3218 RepID=A0A2K1IRH7_PHYPA|nr:hypothetical protein PHYPA_025998 [Physcomitrium patens]